MRLLRVLIVLFLTSFTLPAKAGEVILINGDRLTGTIVAAVEGKLQLRSPLLGTVEIDMTHIESLSSDEMVTIVLADGRTLARRLHANTAGTVQLLDEQGRMEGPVPLENIAALNPPPEEKPAWTGSVSGGLTSIHGNTSSQSLQASGNIMKRRESDRTSLGADYGRAKKRNDITRKDETSEDWWRMQGKYDLFFHEKLYGYIEGRYAVDKVADLDRRITGGTGVGYQWIETERMNFSTEAGLAYVTEKYRNDGSSDRLTAQVNYHFDMTLFERLTFRNNLSYFPSTENISDYYLTTTFELRARMLARMFANFRTIFDYDAKPAPGKSSTDIKHILGVGWDF